MVRAQTECGEKQRVFGQGAVHELAEDEIEKLVSPFRFFESSWSETETGDSVCFLKTESEDLSNPFENGVRKSSWSETESVRGF